MRRDLAKTALRQPLNAAAQETSVVSRAIWAAISTVVVLLAGCAQLSNGRTRQERHPPGRGTMRVVWSTPTHAPFQGEYIPAERGSVELSGRLARIYLGDHTGAAIALSPGGGILQTRALGAAVHSTPLVDHPHRHVYFGTDQGHVFALDSQSLGFRWAARVQGRVRQQPLLFEDAVIVVTESDQVVALSRLTGELLWRYVREPAVGLRVEGHAGLLLHEHRRLLTAFTDGAVVALNPSDGEVLWEVDTSIDVEEPEQGLPRLIDVDTTPLLIGGELFVASVTAGLYILLPDDGQVVGRESWLTNVNAISKGDEGELLISSSELGLVSYDVQARRARWRKRVRRGAPSSAAYWNGVVVFGESAGAFIALDARTGREMDRFDLGTGFSAPPKITSSSQGFVRSDGGTLVSFTLQAAAPQTDREPYAPTFPVYPAAF